MSKSLFNPMNIIAEYATNTDSMVTMLQKEETLTSIMLANEYAIDKAAMDYKMSNIKLMIENTNPYILTEGVLGSIIEFFKRIFTALADAIKSLFSNRKSMSKEEIKEASEKIYTRINKIDNDIKSNKIEDFVIENFEVVNSVMSTETAYDPILYMSEATANMSRIIRSYLKNIETVISRNDIDIDIEYDNKELIAGLKHDLGGRFNHTEITRYIDHRKEGLNEINMKELKREIMLDTFGYNVLKNIKYSDALEKVFGTQDPMAATINTLSLAFQYPTMQYEKVVGNVMNSYSDFTKELDNLNNKSLPNSIEKLKTSGDIDAATINKFSSAVTRYLKQLASDASVYGKCLVQYSACRNIADNIRSRMIKHLTQIDDKFYNKNESVIMHGEQIDSDTMFDDEELIRDFAPSTWMDLALEAAYSSQRELDTMDYERCYKEALMISAPMSESSKLAQLIYINEAVAKKLANFVKGGIEAIKRIFKKFAEALAARRKDNKPYLNKYRDTILQQAPKQREIKMKDCFTGIKRLANSKIPYFDYNSIKNNMGTEEDAQAWLKSILPVKNDSTTNGINDFPAWCKAYFCVADESPMITYEMSNSNSVNMTDVFNFLYDEGKIDTQIKQDLTNLEKTATNIAVAADTVAGSNVSQTNAPTQQNAAYSFLLGRALTESALLEFETVAPEKKQEPADPNKASANVQGTSGEAKDDNTAQKNIQNAGNNNENLQAIKSQTDNYLKVVRTFFAAKLTAIEFIHKEFMGITRMHVKDFIQGDTQNSSKAVGTNYQNNQ